MLRRKRFPLLLAAVALTLVGASEARACSCGASQTVLDEYEWADLVMIVRAEAVERARPAPRPAGQADEQSKEEAEARDGQGDGAGYRGVISTRMVVEKVYKGDLKPGEVMSFGQGGGADCIWTFDEEDVGRRFLFYTKAFEGTDLWFASTCGRSRPAESAHDDLLYLDNIKSARGRTRLSGTVSFEGEYGGRLDGIKIRVAGPRKSVVARTDEHGVYEVYDLPPGRYRVMPELPHGWKVDNYWLRYSPSFVGRDRDPRETKEIVVAVEERRHAGLDLHLEVANAIAGRLLDPAGKPLDGVCLNLVPADEGANQNLYKLDCTENGGHFRLSEIPPGRYLLVVNNDGEVTANEPFGTFYYPNAARREDATVFTVGAGDFIEGLQIHAPVTAETVTVEGLFLYSDGKPVAGERVEFRAAGKEKGSDARAQTDARGRFTIKLLRGAQGRLWGEMYTYVGKFENCPKLDKLVTESGTSVPNIQTPPVEIRADTNLYGVELRYPFPGCKKKPEEK